ncbi:MAG: hypothetical protein ABI629_17620 [bacterium]
MSSLIETVPSLLASNAAHVATSAMLSAMLTPLINSLIDTALSALQSPTQAALEARALKTVATQQAIIIVRRFCPIDPPDWKKKGG